MRAIFTLSDRIDEYFSEGRYAAGILGIAGLVGALTVCVMAPGAAQIFAVGHKKRYTYKNKNWKRTFTRLEQAGFLAIKRETERSYTYTLTEKGLMHLLSTYPHPKKISKVKWDGKWRLIVFDIQETKKRIREVLRKQIKSLGFIQLQQSVWISPYPLHENFLKILKDGVQLESVKLHYFHVTRFEGDKKLLKKFSVK